MTPDRMYKEGSHEHTQL